MFTTSGMRPPVIVDRKPSPIGSIGVMPRAPFVYSSRLRKTCGMISPKPSVTIAR